MQVQLDGIEELRRKLKAMEGSLTGAEASRVYLTAARKLRDAAKRNAPVGKHPAFTNLRTKVAWVPGTLRKAIVAFSRRLTAMRAQGPAAYVRVNIFQGATRAPHGHLVAFGTQARRPKRKRMMVFLNAQGSGWVRAAVTKPMPANPYFQKAVESAGTAALDEATRMQQKLIEKALT